ENIYKKLIIVQADTSGLQKLEGDTKRAQQVLNQLGMGTEQVSEVTVDKSRGRLVITAEDPDNSTPEIVRRIVYSGGEILSVSIAQPSLEEAYLKFVKG
ncbi:DUF4162 domain-containing protein, partial [Candidatus Bathyarchaeota archaeon]|nr:DUF4162 domain-containing protein [Candidatus Bathyarchaeota archaeon]